MLKSLQRSIRYHPLVERFQRELRIRDGVAFNEINLFVPVGGGAVIVDAGANVGAITSKCARTRATVHAFEPNRTCFEILRRRFRYMPNVHLHNAGLMDRDCTLTLSTPLPHRHYDAVDTTVAASFVANQYDAPVVSYEVKCIDVAAFVQSVGRRIALFKMDIEGAEVRVINRLLDQGLGERVTMAVVETHERFSPELAEQTKVLKERVKAEGLASRFRFDWV